MARLQASVSLALLLLASACSPEVLLATNPATGGAGGGGGGGLSGAGGGGVAGSASSGESGAGDMGGEAGADSVLPEAPRLLADSVADFDLVQGKHGWLYGYDDGTTEGFELMTTQSTIRTYTPLTEDKWECWAYDDKQWTQLFELGGHGNGVDTSAPSMPLLQRAVRRWVSTFAGAVIVSGEIAKIDVTPTITNGIEASLVIDGVVLKTWFVAGEDSGGWSYKVDTTVNVGSFVDFVIDPFESSDHHDLTRFTAVIARADVSSP